MNDYMKKRYRNRKDEAIVFLGGKGVDCGSKENLELDHKDRSQKEFDLSKIWSGSKIKYYEELNKCQLLCYACHKEKTRIELSVEHGGGKTGKKNCRCELCAPLKNKYRKRYR